MSAQIIDGDAIAAGIIAEVKADVEKLAAAGRTPMLRAVLVGDNPASKMYARMQAKSCEEVGIKYELDELSEDTDEAGLIAHIEKLNNDSETTGIILQMPLPKGFDGRKVQATIAAHKDAEGMNPANLGRLVYGSARPGPCTAVGAVELLKTTGVPIEGAECLVVGHSEIVGKPIALLMLGLNATVHVCHIFTKDLAEHTKKADILFVAAGKSQAVYRRYQSAKKKDASTPLPDLSPLVSADMIKDGAAVIDVAINRIPAGFDENGEPLLTNKGKPKSITVGDVDFEAAKEKTSFITPVPGGVGPMTVALLLRNTMDCAKLQSR